MKTLPVLLLASSIFATHAHAQQFTNILRQIQLPSGVQRDVQVADEGSDLSPLAIDDAGARFELWAIQENFAASFLLDHKYVSAYAPAADIAIVTEDPYDVIPRTRADRPFDVLVQTHGLDVGNPEAPDAAKQVRLMRHVQSFGFTNGENIDRTQALLEQSVYLDQNALHHFSFDVTSVPGTDRSKVRGEERFSVYTLDHHDGTYQIDSSQIASLRMQVWPVATASISGVQPQEMIRFDTPAITVDLVDLYPDSTTSVFLYRGTPQFDEDGNPVLNEDAVMVGAPLVHYGPFPRNETLVLRNWDNTIKSDGDWTMEVRTQTPFGIDRLAQISFVINRSIEVQGSVSTLD